MPTLHLTDQMATLQRAGEAVVVIREGKTIMHIPVHRVERVLVLGNAQVTTQALTLLLAHGADISFLTINGKLKGRLTSPQGKTLRCA